MNIIRIRAIVSGRVQGVYYRASTQEEAIKLKLAGHVKNLETGEVEIEAEGPKEMVEALVNWARQGPAHARVDGLAITHLSPRNRDESFSILYD